MKQNRDVVLIAHILDAISEIESFVKNTTYPEFFKDTMKRAAVVRNLEIVGEAASKISKEFQKKNSTIPWSDIVGMRNKLIHDYFDVDYGIVWEVVQSDLNVFKKGLKPKKTKT